MAMRFYFLCVLFLLNACGGGSRGTGDLTVSGTTFSNTGAPIANATVTISATGESVVTDERGQFLIKTEPFAGDVEFVIQAQGKEFTSRGGSINEEVEELAVRIQVDFREDKPKATQEIEIRRQRNRGSDDQKNENSGSDNQQRNSTDSEDTGSRGPSDNNSSNSGNSSTGSSPSATPPAQDDDSSPSDSGDQQSSGRSDDSSEDSRQGNSQDDDSNDKPSPSPSASPSASPTASPNDDDSESKPEDKQEITVEGAISALSSNSLTVTNIQFFTSASTEYDKRKSLRDFSIGENVEVRGVKVNGEWIATRIRLKN